MNKKVLIIVGGIWEPAISMAGTKVLYKLIKKISEKNKNVHVLTTISSWTDKNYREWYRKQEKELGIKFHFVKATYFESIPALNLLVTRFMLLVKTYSLNKKYNYSLVHDFVSSTVLFSSSFFYKYLMKLKVVYSIITFNKKFNGNYNFLYNIRDIDQIVCGSRYTYNQIKKSGIHDKKTTFLPIGLDLSEYRSLEIDNKYIKKCGLHNNRKAILFVGPLEERKGIFLFSRCVKEIVKKNKDVVGVVASYGKSDIDPNHDENKKKLINIIGKNNIIFLPGKQNIKQLMIRSQVMALPYTTLHGTLIPPVTLIEAMVTKCNIVTTKLNEIEGVLSSDEGLYFKKDDLRDYVVKTERCLEGNKNYGDKARKKALLEYDIEKNTDKLLEIYNKYL